MIRYIYCRLYQESIAPRSDSQLMRDYLAVFIGAINYLYVFCAIYAALAVLGIPLPTLRSYAGPLTAVVSVLVVAAHFYYLSKPNRHAAILEEFDQRPITGALSTVLVVIWFVGGPITLMLLRAVFGPT
jgi:hypothetical protein